MAIKEVIKLNEAVRVGPNLTWLVSLWISLVPQCLMSCLSKDFTCNGRDSGVIGSIPGSRRSPGGRHSNPLQYSCLENPRDRGAWWATVHGVTKRHNWSEWACTKCYKKGRLGHQKWTSKMHTHQAKTMWRPQWAGSHLPAKKTDLRKGKSNSLILDF